MDFRKLYKEIKIKKLAKEQADTKIVEENENEITPETTEVIPKIPVAQPETQNTEEIVSEPATETPEAVEPKTTEEIVETKEEAGKEITDVIDTPTDVETVPAEELTADASEELDDTIAETEEEIQTNEELIEGEAEPTDAIVKEQIYVAKHLAYKTAMIDKIRTDAVVVENRKYLATESSKFNNLSNRDKLKEANIVLKQIVSNLKSFK